MNAHAQRQHEFDGSADDEGDARAARGESLSEVESSIIDGDLFRGKWVLASVCDDFMATDDAPKDMAALIAGNSEVREALLSNPVFARILTGYANAVLSGQEARA